MLAHIIRVVHVLLLSTAGRYLQQVCLSVSLQEVAVQTEALLWTCCFHLLPILSWGHGYNL